ncbi:MAG: sensor domain-containing diguanylate cyclase [Limnospira sp.]
MTEAQMNGRTSVDPRWRAIREDDTDFPGEEHPAMVTLRTGEPQTDVIMGVHKPDGSLVWISINSQPLFDAEKNSPYAVVTSFTDITEKRQLEIDLQESEELFRGIFEQATVGVGIFSSACRFLKVNEGMCNLSGYSVAELEQMTFLDLTYSDDRDLSLDYHRNLWSHGTSTSVDKRYLHKDGQIVWVNLTVSPIYNVRGELRYAVGIAVDISARKWAEITVRKQAERERMLNAIACHIRQSLVLELILQATVDEVRNFLETDRVIIYRLNPDWSGIVVTESVVPEYLAILNMEITDSYFVETEGGNYHEGKVNNVPDIYNMGFSECHIKLLEMLQVRAKLVVPIFQNSQIWGLLIAHHCRSPHQWQPLEVELLEQLANQVAIAIRQAELHRELQQKNQELENLVLVDELTQIANRRCFDRTLNHEWWRSLRQKMPLSLILCDIDYFKQFNDSYGHLVGDECLKIVARTLQRVARRESDLVARYGGEEFVMILPDTNSSGALQTARSLRAEIHALNLPHIGSKIASYLTLSMGVATRIPTAEDTAIDLLNAADAALYQAKEGGRDRFFICGR